MSELETGWNLSRIKEYLRYNRTSARGWLERLTDDQGIALYLALEFSIRSGLFGDEQHMQAAVSMWEELNKIFGEEE